MLSNGSSGVFFNDSTKIVLDTNAHDFYYYERKTVQSGEKQDVLTQHNLTTYPKELQKKVTLLQHFRSYLENNQQEGARPDSVSSEQQVVYVKKWMRTKHAIMFRLSNKIVQVNFQDHTEILLNSESRLVTYVNKKGERATLPLNQALESNNLEMTKRLKYTKDILTHMLNNNTKGGSQAASSRRSGGPDAIQSPSTAGGMMSSDRRPLNILN